MQDATAFGDREPRRRRLGEDRRGRTAELEQLARRVHGGLFNGGGRPRYTGDGRCLTPLRRLANMFRLCGTYAARILKGDKPADLPVQRSSKVDLIINLNTAKALGVTIPEKLLATADEVIE
jgi:ABC transporter substrate binding protein